MRSFEQRVQRDHGRSFDRLVAGAREQLDDSKAADAMRSG
jgi:hypothetical protein